MRKLALVFIALLVVALSACGQKGSYTITVDKENLQMYISEETDLQFTIKNKDEIVEKEVEFIVGDPNVLEVTDSKVTALKEGETTITIKIKDQKNVEKIINVKVGSSLVITKPAEFVFASQELVLNATDKADKDNSGVTWLSSDPSIASVNNGVVKGHKPGNVTITITSNTNKVYQTITLEVKKIDIAGLEIESVGNVGILSKFVISHKILPNIALQAVTWVSSDESILTIDNEGNAHALTAGEVTLTATSVADTAISATITFKVEVDPMQILETMNVENTLKQWVTTYGNTELQQWVYGSVNRYFNADMNLRQQIVPINQNKYTGTVANESTILDAENQLAVRSGIKHVETNSIVFHDTGNNSTGANAQANVNWMNSTGNTRARSWHYTVDENEVIQQIPDDEVSWQGDHFDAYAYGIGVETCVDFGSDLYTTWQRNAKLMASLLVKHNLTTKDIKQHFDFPISGPNGIWYKNCPQTLRRSNLYGEAIALIEAEYNILTLLDGYTISFKSLNPTYVDDRGRVIELPATATRVGYIVNITKDDYNESKVLYSTIPGEDGTTEATATGTPADFEAANAVDNAIALLPTTIAKTDSVKISAAREAYNALTQGQKELVAAFQLLIDREIQFLRLDAVNTTVVINQVLLSNNNVTKYGFIELYNATDDVISLKGWTIQYAEDETEFSIASDKLHNLWYQFSDDAVIEGKGYFLLQINEGTSVGDNYLPLPDAVTNILLNGNGKIALTNNVEVVTAVDNNHVIDFVGYGNVNLYEGTNPFKGLVENNSFTRLANIDTNNNERDFIVTSPNPRNSLNETINVNITDSERHAMEIDIAILSLPTKLVLADESKVIAARNAYNALTATEKALVGKLELLDKKEKEILGLKDPDYIALYEALDLIPNQIVNDFTFPVISGVTYTIKEGQDTTCFDLATGKLLKASYEYKPVILVATKNAASFEFTVNFGLLQKDQLAIFATGTKVPKAGGQTQEGNGTYNEQFNTAGFGGVTITFNNKVYFIGKNAFIPLNKPASGNKLTQAALKPHGNNNIFNESLVNGFPTSTNGTGVLYYNSSDIDLTFDPSYTYGRNNSGNYGYAKIVFSPNADGTYSVNKPWADSGTNTTTNNTTKTLKPGEYLFCPHQYETNKNGGTWLMVGGVVGTSGTGVLKEGSIISIATYKYQFN